MADYEIRADTAAKGLQKVLEKLGGKAVSSAIGVHVANLVSAHLMRYNQEHPNALGGKRTNYYAKAAKATSYQETADGVQVSVAQVGIGLLYHGGTVYPGKGISIATGKPTKRLTIPAIAEAHGKRAADFGDGLAPLWGKAGPYALAYKGSKTVVFWLAKKATIGPHKDLLPTKTEVRDAIRDAVADLASQIK